MYHTEKNKKGQGIQMDEMNKLNEQEIEKVVGGISQDEALEAALKHAGLLREQLDFLKDIKPDWEHDKQVFEIEFYSGGFEYEYNVDAVTGQILKFEKERD